MVDVYFRELGTVAYQEGLDIQFSYFNKTVETKTANRKRELQEPTQNYLLLCEHKHVYTLGRSGDKNNLLINTTRLKEREAEYFETGRGGDITYHGPGQLVLYPILDLDHFFTDIHKYMRYLEEVVIKTCADFGIEAGRVEGLTGVWIDIDSRLPRKICAMGVKASRWVTMHGLALNVNPDLSYFSDIVPCGITDKPVTSMAKETQRDMTTKEVAARLIENFKTVFEVKLTPC